jgi:hypothetical protein
MPRSKQTNKQIIIIIIAIQLNPAYIITSCFLRHMILSTPMILEWLLPLSLYEFLIFSMHVTCSTYLIISYLIVLMIILKMKSTNNVTFIMLYHQSCYLMILRSNCSPVSIYVLPLRRDTAFHPCRKRMYNYIFVQAVLNSPLCEIGEEKKKTTIL